MVTEEKISIREFARRCGADDRTVRNAIKDGHIKKGYDKKVKKILADTAYREWGVKFKARKINDELTKISTQDLEKIGSINIDDIQLNVNDPQIVLDRKHVFIKANRDLLKLKTESGELQSKEDTYKKLFEFGKEMRTAFQAIPDRIVDQLITSDRPDAHRLLTEAINEVLLKLSSHVD